MDGVSMRRMHGTNVPARRIDQRERTSKPRRAIHRRVGSMNRTWVVAVALSGLMMIPVAARAAERTLVGNITKIEGSNVTVKSMDGKEETVVLNAKTKVSKGTKKVDAKTLSVGDRIVAWGPEDKSEITAKTI